MTKDFENWQLLQELFHLAEATPKADRERALAEKCSDEELCRRALNILKASTIEAAAARFFGSFDIYSPSACSPPTSCESILRVVVFFERG